MGQQSEEQKPSSAETSDSSEEGSFLSPEETSLILSSLEAIDQKVLGKPNPPSAGEDEGVFISPEEIEAVSAAEYARAETPSAPQPASPARAARPSGADSSQSDLLSRIAGELRSIKTEIGTLKNTYDDMISKAASISSSEARSETLAAAAPVPSPAIAGQMVPDETLADLKKLLGYLDRLLESLPEDKIDGFARSEYFELYRKIFEFFDLV